MTPIPSELGSRERPSPRLIAAGRKLAVGGLSKVKESLLCSRHPLVKSRF